MLFDFVDGGAHEEETLAANRRDLTRLALDQKICIDVSARSTATTVLGETIDMPLVLAPAGLTGLLRPGGEVMAAQAAAAAGIPYCLSTMSVCSLEQLASAAGRPFWFQLYMMKDRGFVRALVERAHKAG